MLVSLVKRLKMRGKKKKKKKKETNFSIDYFNPRNGVFVNKLMTGALWLSTTGVLVGCYQFNTNDIGLTEFISKLWV